MSNQGIFLEKFVAEIVQQLLQMRRSDGGHGEVQSVLAPPNTQQAGAWRDAVQINVFEGLPLALPTKHHLPRRIQPLQTGLGQDLNLRPIHRRFTSEAGATDQTRPHGRALAQGFWQGHPTPCQRRGLGVL